MRNVELKVRCQDLAPVRQRALALGAEPAAVLAQTDTYLRVAEGRLKIREMAGRAELIRYRRPDQEGARLCDYRVLPLAAQEGAGLRDMLAEALGVLVVVVKRRELLLYRHTRIHLDRVDGLGPFVELETVITEQPHEAAASECDEISLALGLDRLESVPGSYSDLLLAPQG